MRVFSYALALSALLPLAIPASAAPLFPAPASFTVGDQPYRMVTSDLNRDGRLDVVTANGATVSVLLGRGDGTFEVSADYQTGGAALSVAVGDVNGDGAPDLATANATASSLSILLGNGDGTFRAHVDTSTGPGPSPQALALADLNADGRLDIVEVDGENLAVLLGLGDGTFPSQVVYPAPGAFVVTSLDANLDGRTDVATAGFDENTFGFDRVSVFLGNGDGTLAPRTDFPSRNVRTRAPRTPRAPGNAAQFGNQVSLASGDLNGDGRPDLAMAANDAVFNASTVAVLLGVGDGTFPTRTSYPVLDFSSDVAIGDATGDGVADLVTANDFSGTISVLRGAGNGTFPSRVDYGSDGFVLSVAIADVNRDGMPDVLTSDKLPSAVTVLLGGDGGGLRTRRGYPAGRFPAGLAVGDLDRDGTPDAVTANSDESTISILYGAANATFHTRVDLATSFFNLDVAVGDMNGDALPDLVSVSDDGTLSVFINQGSRTFGARIDTSPVSARDLEIADVNGDGRADVVTANSGSMTVFLGRGDGTFLTPTEIPGNAVRVAVGDLNADGRPDLVATGFQSSLLTILLGNGDGTFQDGLIEVSGPGALSAAIADLNHDGRADIVTADQAAPGGVSVLLGNGDGTFQTHVDYATNGSRSFLAVGDLDGDGAQDVAAAGSALSVLLGNGDGTLSLSTIISAGRGPARVAIADLDRDGAPEIVALDRSAFIVSVFRRTPSNRSFDAGVAFDPSNLNLANRSALVSVFIEPTGFSPSGIDIGTVRLQNSVAPAPKFSLVTDHDGDGLPELQLKFRRADLDPLLVLGVNRLDLTGSLISGGTFRGTGDLRAMIPAKGPKHVTVTPNPINPEGSISFYLDEGGPVRVRIYDRGGRLVRTLLDTPSAARGAHQINFDGTNDRGARVASGVYFYRIDTAQGPATGRLAVVK